VDGVRPVGMPALIYAVVRLHLPMLVERQLYFCGRPGSDPLWISRILRLEPSSKTVLSMFLDIPPSEVAGQESKLLRRFHTGSVDCGHSFAVPKPTLAHP